MLVKTLRATQVGGKKKACPAARLLLIMSQSGCEGLCFPRLSAVFGRFGEMLVIS